MIIYMYIRNNQVSDRLPVGNDDAGMIETRPADNFQTYTIVGWFLVPHSGKWLFL